jgi:hypothetical protein
MKQIVSLLLLALLLQPVFSFAHKNHEHSKPTGSKPESVASGREFFGQINEDYSKTVKPIFEKKCMDCHSQNPRYPWYHGLPFVKGLIDGDIAESRTHLDLTDGFPFKGHGSPSEDLEAIAGSIKEGSMPPLRYLVMHPSAKISDEDKEAILSWIGRSQDLLKK